MLDPVPLQTLFPLMAEISDDLYRHGLQDAFRAFDDIFLIALDRMDFFSFQKFFCPCCPQSTLANGKTLYRHSAVTPVLVAPSQENVIAPAHQFVQPQDGHAKQDCELAASGCWLARWGAHYTAWGSTFLGNDLYCHQPFCQQILAQKANFIFTCKPESHPAL